MLATADVACSAIALTVLGVGVSKLKVSPSSGTVISVSVLDKCSLYASVSKDVYAPLVVLEASQAKSDRRFT